MNKKGNENRSVRNTKKRLRDGLLQLMSRKSVDLILVKELTDLVDINRGTFYYHYSNTRDMLDQLEAEFLYGFSEILSSLDEASSYKIYIYLTEIFTFLGKNQDFCRIILGPNGDTNFISKLKELVEDKCSYFWELAIEDNEKLNFPMFNAFIINACMGILENWLANGLEESPSEIAELAYKAILASIKAWTQGVV